MLGAVRIPSSNSVYTSSFFPQSVVLSGLVLVLLVFFFHHNKKCIYYDFILGQKRMSVPPLCLPISWFLLLHVCVHFAIICI